MNLFLHNLLTEDSHSKGAGIVGAIVSFIAPFQNDLVRSLISFATGFALWYLTKTLERKLFKKKDTGNE